MRSKSGGKILGYNTPVSITLSETCRLNHNQQSLTSILKTLTTKPYTQSSTFNNDPHACQTNQNT